MPRVLILVQNEPAPSDRHVWNQATALQRNGYDVTIICPKGQDRGASHGASHASVRSTSSTRAVHRTSFCSPPSRCAAAARASSSTTTT